MQEEAMGAYYEVSAIVPLDPAKEAEYLPVLEQMAGLDVKAKVYGIHHWIGGAGKMSHQNINRIEELLAQLGRYATEAVRVATRYEDGDVEPLWIGPDALTIVKAQIAEVEQEMARLAERLAALKEEELCLQQHQDVS